MKKKKRRKIKAVGFDFDGTLILSEDVKKEIAASIFLKRYGVKKGVKSAYASMTGKGIPRARKIEKLFVKFLKRKPKKKELAILNNDFSKEYEKKLMHCPVVKCINILSELKKQTKFMFLLSLENRTQVMNIAKNCNLRKYFDEILGGPKSKIINLKHVLKKHKVQPEETIYIGDSKGDIIASKKLRIKAIRMRDGFNHSKLLKKLGKDFTFSKVCKIPYKRVR